MSKKAKVLACYLSGLLVLAGCSNPPAQINSQQQPQVENNSIVNKVLTDEQIVDSLPSADKEAYNNLVRSANQIDKDLAARIIKNARENHFTGNSEPYESLKIGKDSFNIKAINSSARWAVILKVGTVDYVLSRSFMIKLREVLRLNMVGSTPDTANNNLKAVFTTTAFNQLKANNGSTVSGYSSTYTNSSSELAFVTLLEKYNSVSMPNYLFVSTDANVEPSDDTGTEAAADHDILPTTDTIEIIVNKTGIRTEYYQAIEAAQVNDNKITSAEITALLGNFTGALIASTAEKTFFNSLLAKNPYAEDVVLLDSNPAIVSRDLKFYYGDADLVTAGATDDTDIEVFASRATASVRNNYTSEYIVGTNMAPTTTENMTGATSSLMAAFLTMPYNDVDTAIEGLDSEAGGDTAFAAFSDAVEDVDYQEFHTAVRSLHMVAGGSTAGTAPGTVAFGTLPTAPVTNTAIADLTVASYGNLGKALDYLGFSGTLISKAGTTLKNKAGIETFFGNDTDTPKKALIVPTTRSTTGTLSFAATGKNYVVITAAPTVVAGQTVYFYKVYDPGYNNGSGSAYYSLGISNPVSTMITSLYNYAGTVVAVQAP